MLQTANKTSGGLQTRGMRKSAVFPLLRAFTQPWLQAPEHPPALLHLPSHKPAPLPTPADSHQSVGTATNEPTSATLVRDKLLLWAGSRHIPTPQQQQHLKPSLSMGYQSNQWLCKHSTLACVCIGGRIRTMAGESTQHTRCCCSCCCCPLSLCHRKTKKHISQHRQDAFPSTKRRTDDPRMAGGKAILSADVALTMVTLFWGEYPKTTECDHHNPASLPPQPLVKLALGRHASILHAETIPPPPKSYFS